jgi:hypothetical protein
MPTVALEVDEIFDGRVTVDRHRSLADFFGLPGPTCTSQWTRRKPVDRHKVFQPTLAQSVWVRAFSALAGGHHRIAGGL